MKKGITQNYQAAGAMSLIEVAIALGIVSFCIVALLGLFPVMLESVRQSHENAVASRIYQLVAEDLRENAPAPSETNRIYNFDYDGLLLTSGSGSYFVATGSNVFAYSLPDGSTNSSNASLIQSQVCIVNQVRQTTVLQRPVWVSASNQ